MRYRTKLFYLGVVFAFCASVIVVRLAYMQVMDAAHYARGVENTRTRIDLHLPSRAEIFDRNGELLATNELVWDVTWDLSALFKPESFLVRYRRDSSAYGVGPADVDSFLRSEVSAMRYREVDSPKRSRRFALAWELREHPFLREDRDLVLAQLSELLGLQYEVVVDKFSLVESEVDAILAEVGGAQAESAGGLNRAYYQALSAMRDPEYWEQIRRFPKSIRFEQALRYRRLFLEESEARAKSFVDAADSRASFVEALRLEQAYMLHQLHEYDSQLGLKLIDESEIRFAPYPNAEEIARIEVSEKRIDLRAWRQQLHHVASRLDELQLVEIRSLLLDYVWDRDLGGLVLRQEATEDLAARHQRVRERIFENPDADNDEELRLRTEWKERWTTYLDFDLLEGRSPRLQVNPLELVRKVTRRQAEALELLGDYFPGVIVSARNDRVYPQIDLMPHLLGHVGLPGPESMPTIMRRLSVGDNLVGLREEWFDGSAERFEKAFGGVMALQTVGQQGLEKFYEPLLAGSPGARVVYRDARGRLRSTEGKWRPKAAKGLQLTIDSEIQAFAKSAIADSSDELREKALSYGTSSWRKLGYDNARKYWSLRGSFVMLDVKTGAVLAMVDFPSYDPALLRAPGEEGRAYRDEVLRGDQKLKERLEIDIPWLDAKSAVHWMKQAPMWARSVSSQSPPGSTFKVVSAIMLAEEDVVRPSDRLDPYDLVELRTRGRHAGKYVFTGNNGFELATGHPAGGQIDLAGALEQSSNEYFWYLSQYLPGVNASKQYEETFYVWARKFGFGERPGLDLPSAIQTRGTFPDNEKHSPKELAMNLIGQGGMGASPLQIARMMCAVATRGNLPTPHLFERYRGPVRRIRVSKETWDAVHRGLRDVVAAPSGTARDSHVSRTINAAGKTGTAESGHFNKPLFDPQSGEPIIDAETGKQDFESIRKPNHAWFTGFAPADDPQVAYVMLAEYSGLYGGDLADVSATIVKRYFELEEKRAQPGFASVRAD